MEKKTTNFSIVGKQVEVSTGDLAYLSHGSILLKAGGTALLATATVDTKDSDLDYFPLSVEYIEKMYARGAISGSRFKKREGLPAEEAIIKAREVDHSIRSLFPKGFKRAVSVVLTVMAYDGVNDPQALTVLGASLALMQSGVPFVGPCASVVIGLDKDLNIVLNPEAHQRESFEAEWIISAVDGKVLSLEGWGKEISNEKMGEVLDASLEEIKSINAQQTDFINQVGKTLDINPEDYSNEPAPSVVIDYVKKTAFGDIEVAMFDDKVDRMVRMSEIKQELQAKVEEDIKAETITSENTEFFTSLNISEATEYVARKILRDAVLNDSKRISGRGLEEIRPLKAEVDILPTVHGSATFSRGLTQSLSIVTLAPKSYELLIDEMEGEETKSFMHHYNFPPFSTGEAGRFRYHPGRREVGHGAIGENALKYMIPSTDEFPYTIRAVSEILSSNGSTSMAATCASSLALMAAGVPLKEQVAGIGVGLVTEDGNEDNYKLLLDIEGVEDFYGDMDFKVTGTKNGITAIQYENKLQGVKPEVLKTAFELALQGRMQVLEAMNEAISAPRSSLAENAPIVKTISINRDEVGDLIGPGGKNIKALIESAKEHGADADISIEQDGEVTIAAKNKAQMDFIENKISFMFKKAAIGEVYEGVVDSIKDFGAFVDVSPKISGLVHKSNISDKFVENPGDHLKEGQTVKVKVISMERGKIGFSMKGIEQPVM